MARKRLRRRHPGVQTIGTDGSRGQSNWQEFDRTSASRGWRRNHQPQGLLQLPQRVGMERCARLCCQSGNFRVLKYFFESVSNFYNVFNLQGNLRPEPREWYHSANDFELKIPKSAPLTYAQLPFYLDGLYDTTDITAVIAQIRDICQRFEERGLPNYPSGESSISLFLVRQTNIFVLIVRHPVLVLGTIPKPPIVDTSGRPQCSNGDFCLLLSAPAQWMGSHALHHSIGATAVPIVRMHAPVGP